MLEREDENGYLAGEAVEAGPMDELSGLGISYRIAVWPQQGRGVFTAQSLAACEEACDDPLGEVAGFSLHAGADVGLHWVNACTGKGARYTFCASVYPED